MRRSERAARVSRGGALVGLAAIAAAIALLPTLTPVPAGTPVSFAGKQIRLQIGFSPTTYGYDTYGRLLAKYLGKYLPGNPTIVPQNRPGAGSLNLASYMANAAPRDGALVERLYHSPSEVIAKAQAIAAAN